MKPLSMKRENQRVALLLFRGLQVSALPFRLL